LVSFSCVFEKQKSGDLYSAYPAHSGSSRHWEQSVLPG
jgi:hypothetical protein